MSGISGSTRISRSGALDSFHVLEDGLDTPEATPRNNHRLLPFCRSERRIHCRVRNLDGSRSRVAAKHADNANERENREKVSGHISLLLQEHKAAAALPTLREARSTLYAR